MREGYVLWYTKVCHPHILPPLLGDLPRPANKEQIIAEQWKRYEARGSPDHHIFRFFQYACIWQFYFLSIYVDFCSVKFELCYYQFHQFPNKKNNNTYTPNFLRLGSTIYFVFISFSIRGGARCMWRWAPTHMSSLNLHQHYVFYSICTPWVFVVAPSLNPKTYLIYVSTDVAMLLLCQRLSCCSCRYPEKHTHDYQL